jgi:putative Mn2+ efflux pump MntP
MSNLGNILLVSLSLGLNNFAATIAIGLSGVDTKTRIKTAIAFGLFEAGMPIIGLLISQRLASSIGDLGRYIGAGLLILTGAYTIWQSVKGNEIQVTQPEVPRLQFKYLLLTGFVLSIDNLVVGFALSLYRVPIFLAALIIAVVSVTMSLLGLELGQRLGEKFEKWSEVIGGVILILVGLALGLG